MAERIDLPNGSIKLISVLIEQGSADSNGDILHI